MLDQNYTRSQPLPLGGQRVKLNERERAALLTSAVWLGLACLGLLIALALTLALGHLPIWGALLLAAAAALPGRAAQNRLLAVTADLRAGTAVIQTARLEGLRREGRASERCYVAFQGVGEFSLAAPAFQQLQRRVGRRYRIVYSANSRILLAIEPV